MVREADGEDGSAGRFRLAGFGGAAWFMRTSVGPGESAASGAPRLCLDVGLLSPDSLTWYLARPCEGEGLPGRLSGFLLAAAADECPESSVPEVQDAGIGLRIRVVSSDAQWVGLLVSVVREPHEPGDEPEVLDFETSRAALAQAAIDVRVLDRVHGAPGGNAEPPSDWVTL